MSQRELAKKARTAQSVVARIDRAVALIGGREAPVDSREVLTLAHKSGCSSYDCEYVALAIALGVMLVTSDKAVLRAFPSVAINPGKFLG